MGNATYKTGYSPSGHAPTTTYTVTACMETLDGSAVVTATQEFADTDTLGQIAAAFVTQRLKELEEFDEKIRSRGPPRGCMCSGRGEKTPTHDAPEGTTPAPEEAEGPKLPFEAEVKGSTSLSSHLRAWHPVWAFGLPPLPPSKPITSSDLASPISPDFSYDQEPSSGSGGDDGHAVSLASVVRGLDHVVNRSSGSGSGKLAWPTSVQHRGGAGARITKPGVTSEWRALPPAGRLWLLGNRPSTRSLDPTEAAKGIEWCTVVTRRNLLPAPAGAGGASSSSSSSQPVCDRHISSEGDTVLRL